MKTEKDIEEILDNVKIPSDEEVEAAGMRFDHRIRRLRMRRRLMWATGSVAAVLCCGLVFTSLWMNRGVKENLGVAEIPRVLKTDHQVAVPTLIFADGNKLNLKEREADSTAGEIEYPDYRRPGDLRYHACRAGNRVQQVDHPCRVYL